MARAKHKTWKHTVGLKHTGSETYGLALGKSFRGFSAVVEPGPTFIEERLYKLNPLKHTGSHPLNALSRNPKKPVCLSPTVEISFETNCLCICV